MNRNAPALLLLSLLAFALLAGCLGDEKSPKRAATTDDTDATDEPAPGDDLLGSGPAEDVDDAVDDALGGSGDPDAPADDDAAADAEPRPAAPSKDPCPDRGILRIAVIGVGICL